MNKPVATDFRQNTADSGHLANYLSTSNTLDKVLAGKAHRARYLGERARTVIDLGCGTGDMIALLAVNDALRRIVGVDLNVDLLNRVSARCGDPRVETLQADAGDLPFADGEFDAALIERTLQHVEEPARVIREAVRVTAPGGTVLVVEPDWSTLGIDGISNRAMTDTVLGAVGSLVRHPFVGRGLRGLMNRAGLVDIRIDVEFHETPSLKIARLLGLLDEGVAEIRATGTVPTRIIESWQDGLVAAEANGDFSASLGLFVAAGTVPAR